MAIKEMEWFIKPKKFKHKKTGAIKTRIDLLEIGEYEEYEDDD